MRLPALVLALVILLGGVTLLVVMATRPPEDGGDPEDGDREKRVDGDVAPGPRRPEPPADPDREPGADDPAPAPAGARIRTRVTGTVLDDRGAPIEGATVSVVDYIKRRVPTTTGRYGTFANSIDARPPFEMVARADGHTSASCRVLRSGEDVRFSLRRLLRIHGQVVDDATGETVGKGTLLLRRLRSTGEPEESGLVDEMKGRFILDDLAPGRYVLTVNVPGYDVWTGEEIRLTRDEPDAKLEVRVGRSGPWGAVKVSIRDPSGVAVTEANRVLIQDSDSGFLAMTKLVVPVPVSLEAPAGRHDLRVLVDGFLPEARGIDVPEGREAEVTVTLRAAGHVRVAVVDAAGEAVRDFRLAIFDADGGEPDYELRLMFAADFDIEIASAPLSVDDPLFAFARQGTIGKNQVVPKGPVELKNLPRGRYRVIATREGVNPAEATVDVEASATAEVRLTLR